MRIVLLLILITAVLAVAWAWFFRTPERWAIYYGDTLPAEDFLPFDLIVFNGQRHPPLVPLKIHHKTLLGYLSLGEAETYRDNFQWMKDSGLILETSPEWKGNPVIDTRKPQWDAYVVDVLVPQIIRQGFDGIMLDTADSPIWLENKDPDRYGGLKQGMIRIIKHIHARYPDLRLMMNRGFDILPQVAGDIDMVLAESIYSYWASADTPPALIPPAVYKDYVHRLRAAKARSWWQLKVYTLDYWPEQDLAGIERIYRAQRKQGFIPCVSGLERPDFNPEPH